MTTVALLRVSDKKQDPASQRASILDYCTRERIVIDRWLGEDGAMSGGVADRSKLDAELASILAMAEAKPRQIDRLIVSASERLGRRGPESQLYLEKLSALGVEVYAAQEGGRIDLKSRSGLLLAGIKATIARDKLLEIGEKTAAAAVWMVDGVTVPAGTPGAVRCAARSGKKWGRRARDFDLDALLALLRTGKTVTEAAALLPGKPSKSVVYARLAALGLNNRKGAPVAGPLTLGVATPAGPHAVDEDVPGRGVDAPVLDVSP